MMIRFTHTGEKNESLVNVLAVLNASAVCKVNLFICQPFDHFYTFSFHIISNTFSIH